MSGIKALQYFARGCVTPNRAQRGLYAGKKIVYGYKVAEDKENSKENHTPLAAKRARKIVIFRDKKMRIKVTTNALRCIDKAGGLDNYILRTQPKDLASKFALDLRQKLKDQLEINKKKNSEISSDNSNNTEANT